MKKVLGCVLAVQDRPVEVLERTLQTYAYQTVQPADKVLLDYGSAADFAREYRRLCKRFGWRLVPCVPAAPGWRLSAAYNAAVAALHSQVDVVFKGDIDVLLAPDILATAVALGSEKLCIFSCLAAAEDATYPPAFTEPADLAELLGGPNPPREMDGEGIHAYPRRWFEEIGGFDLAFLGWGYEDSDLRERAKWSIGVLCVKTCLLIHQWHPTVRRPEDAARNLAYYRKMVEGRQLVRNGGALTGSSSGGRPVGQTDGLKLNLGCGADLRAGWLNVDCRPLHPEGPEFVCCDLLALDGRVADGAADRILARGVLECVPWREVDALLTVLVKKLRPGGALSLRLPDAEQIARAFGEGTLTHHEAQRLLYGDQAHPEDARRSLWSAEEVRRRLQMVGLTVERLERRGNLLHARGRRLS